MIERAVFLHEVCISCFKFIHVFDFVQAIEDLLENKEFEELHNKFPLDDVDWEALETYQEILQVDMSHALLFMLTTFQIPHAFQHILSKEKTPTLSHVIPAFEGMIEKWEEYIEAYPNAQPIVQDGLDKVGTYQNCADQVPAYVLAVGVSLSLLYQQEA